MFVASNSTYMIITLEISFIISLIIMMTNIFFNLNIKIKSNKKIEKKEIKWMW